MDLELGGRAKAAKGIASVETTVAMLLDLLAAHPVTDASRSPRPVSAR